MQQGIFEASNWGEQSCGGDYKETVELGDETARVLEDIRFGGVSYDENGDVVAELFRLRLLRTDSRDELHVNERGREALARHQEDVELVGKMSGTFGGFL